MGGIFTEMLAKEFKKVYAVDGSYTSLTKLKENFRAYKNIFYIQSFIEHLILNNKLDNIVMSMILERSWLISEVIDIFKKDLP